MLGIKTDKKSLMIFGAAVGVLVLIIASALLSRKEKPLSAGPGVQPSFLAAEEKQELNISPNLRIQAISRDQNGKVTVYKIINSDSDIVSDPSSLGPVNPPRSINQ